MDSKQKLKIGQQFEVVEVLTDGGYVHAFKVGGCTVAKIKSDIMYKTLTNFDSETHYPLRMRVGEEVKPVGRLTVTKIK